MKNKLKKLRFLFGFSSLFIIGCEPSVDIRIADLTPTITVHDIYTSGGYREAISTINNKKNCFYTVQRVGNKLKIRTRDFNGKEINTKLIPLLKEGYAGSNDIKISPDCTKIIYYNDDTYDLMMYNINTNVSSILMHNISSSCVYLLKLDFITSDTLLIALSEDDSLERKYAEILKFNITKRKKTIIHTSSITDTYWRDFNISPDKTQLAYCNHSNIRIIDLTTTPKTKTIALIHNIDYLSASFTSWSPNGENIAYTEDNHCKIYNIKTKTVKTINSYPQDAICYELKFINNKQLIYLLGIPGKGKMSHYGYQPLRILDIKTGKDIKMVNNFQLNGNLYIVKDGKKIIGEVGF